MLDYSTRRHFASQCALCAAIIATDSERHTVIAAATTKAAGNATTTAAGRRTKDEGLGRPTRRMKLQFKVINTWSVGAKSQLSRWVSGEKVGEKVEGKGGGQKPGKIGKIRETLEGEEKRGYGSGSATSCP